jgi:hypothetical protein
MQGPVYNELTPVRRRQQWLFAWRAAVLGLLAGSVACLGVLLARWLTDRAELFPWAGAALLAGPVVGFVAGFLWKIHWHAAAVAVDSTYQLKDRTATALTFVTLPSTTPIHELQVRDAVQHLASVEPRKVVPWKMPRSLPFAVGSLLLNGGLALLILLWPLHPSASDASPPEPLPGVLAEAERIEETLKEFEELAKQEKLPELEDLVKELREKVDEMKKPTVDLREALSLISEMQAAITAQQAQYNVGLVDGQLQALGTAMSSAAALEGAGKAMAEAKYEKAVQELEKIEDPQLDRKEAKALEEELRKAAQSCADCGLGSLSEAATELAEGAKSGNGAKMQKATRELAKLVRGQQRRKRIVGFLEAEVERMNEGKNNAKEGMRARFFMPYKSNSPSSDWGLEVSGNVLGNKTNLLSQRNLEAITGNPGEGPSDIETTHSAEGRQQGSRAYRDVYKKYQRLSEAVLDSEPIPLGHRQTIRRYFQLIRPQEGDAEKGEASPK